MSTPTRLDCSDRERRLAMELVSALNEPGMLDELGIGTIRDTIAEKLFPGIPTIQTRARYLLFIPWILQMVEEGSLRGAEDRTRRLQLQIRNALVTTHSTNERGVIGCGSGRTLQSWPLYPGDQWERSLTSASVNIINYHQMEQRQVGEPISEKAQKLINGGSKPITQKELAAKSETARDVAGRFTYVESQQGRILVPCPAVDLRVPCEHDDVLTRPVVIVAEIPVASVNDALGFQTEGLL